MANDTSPSNMTGWVMAPSQKQIDAILNNYTCSDFTVLPFINEYTWSTGTRIFLYFVALLWMFMGVAIIADTFMCAIERITSKTTKLRIPDATEPEGFKELDVKVWNSTVANLSLLALGTSAPEILLSVIEIITNEFRPGPLGPGTIVGSAAFNLFVISGICVYCIGGGDTRKIENLKVYAVTATSCIFAYLWLAIVLIGITPNVVDVWEAVLTLLFFPLLIFIAYMADRNCCMGRATLDETAMVGIAMDKDEERPAIEKSSGHLADVQLMNLAKELGHDAQEEGLTAEEAAKMAAAKMAENQSHSRMWYRINAIRGTSGGKRLVPHVMSSFQGIYNHINTSPDEKDEGIMKVDHSQGGTKAVVEFTASSVSVLESEKKVRIGIRRTGKLEKPVTVRVETINGTAIAPEDYVHFKEEVKFSANEQLRQIYIEIVDDNEWEPDEFFFVKMCFVDEVEEAVFGPISITQVTIINDDEPGKLEFAKPSIIAKESKRFIRVPVSRINGADGHVNVKWTTKDITAIAGKDYTGGSGELIFDHGETSRTIDIEIFPSNKAERDESFQIDLGEMDGGATPGKILKCIITIVNDEEFNGLVSRIVNLTKFNLDSLQLEDSTWASQFKTGMNVNGGDVEEATLLDYILHFINFFWKVLFAFVPPPKYLGGWPAFIVSLSLIGLMTAIIGDLAGILGCLIGIPPAITAITFVALGTSMPDTFASIGAAQGEKTADASVGNINGSNSVNVFLGLGLPWTIASIYWAAKGEQFDYTAGSLGFTVVIYAIFAIIAMSMLIGRRLLGVFGKAELGGPQIPKIISAVVFVLLWVFYIIISSLEATGKIVAPF